jgi:AGZA family xanthine/uracil permease-like MFS transporter
MLERVFKLRENNTTVRTEVMAGFTTFMTMAYILAVNPGILSAAGMDAGGVLLATATAAAIGTLIMAFMANYPFALAPGMGLNAYFAFTVCLSYGYDYRIALAAVFVEGLVFILLSITNVREAIFNAIPISLKHGVSAGIGLFIAFIGLQNGKLVVHNDATLVSCQQFLANIHTGGICAILTLVGVVIITVLYHRNVKGSILLGIASAWLLGMAAEKLGIYVPDPATGYFSMFPNLSQWNIGDINTVFGQVFNADFSNVSILEFITIVFAFLFVDLFDTIGTLIGVATKTNMLDKNGRLPRIKGALLADAIATTAGAICGTSTTTTYVESATGASVGGRTGLTAATVAVLFLLSIFLSPIFIAVPGFATAAALIFVGFLMLGAVARIDFESLTDAVPAYLCIIGMPLFYSISEGIAVGVISYVAINVLAGKAGRVNALMYVLALLFFVKYIFL